MKGFQVYPKLIYILECPISKQVVYVGSSQNLYKRLLAHMNNPSNELKPWIDSLKEKMLCPIITEIDRTDVVDRDVLETYWIHQFETWGFNLLNTNARIRSVLSYSPKRAPVKNIKIAPEKILFWKSKKDPKDFKIISNRYGIGKERIYSAFNTGVCRPDVYNVIDEYFIKKAS